MLPFLPAADQVNHSLLRLTPIPFRNTKHIFVGFLLGPQSFPVHSSTLLRDYYSEANLCRSMWTTMLPFLPVADQVNHSLLRLTPIPFKNTKHIFNCLWGLLRVPVLPEAD